MGTFYKLEIEKLVRRVSTLICFALIFAYGITTYHEWVDPFGSKLYLMDEDGTIRHGRDAIRSERKWMEPYRGVLTDAHVEEILRDSKLRAGQQVLHMQNVGNGEHINEIVMPYAERVAVSFFLMNEFAYQEYAEDGQTVAESMTVMLDTPRLIGEVFPDSALPLRLEYAPPWTGMLTSMFLTMFGLNFVALFMISPVFSEEHTHRMNALLFTSKFGKRKCFHLKAAAAFSLGGACALTVILFHVLITLLFFGKEGLAGSIQIAGQEFLYGDLSYSKTVGSAVFDAALLYTADVFYMVSLTVLGSVLVSGALRGVLLSLAFWAAPMILTVLDAVPLSVKMIAPVVHKTDFAALLRLPDVAFGSITVPYSRAAAGVLVLLSVLITGCASWIYRHVTGE